MSIQIQSTNCCGFNEINNLAEYEDRPKQAMIDICHQIHPQNENAIQGAYLFFTGVISDKYGQQLAKFIKENNLGSVTKAPSKKNLKSNHLIAAWIWTLNRPTIRKWAQKHDCWNPYD